MLPWNKETHPTIAAYAAWANGDMENDPPETPGYFTAEYPGSPQELLQLGYEVDRYTASADPDTFAGERGHKGVHCQYLIPYSKAFEVVRWYQSIYGNPAGGDEPYDPAPIHMFETANGKTWARTASSKTIAGPSQELLEQVAAGKRLVAYSNADHQWTWRIA